MRTVEYDDEISLSAFSSRRPAYETEQRLLLDWIADAHATSTAVRDRLNDDTRRALRDRLRRVIDRCACGPASIARRGHVLAEVGSSDWDRAALYDLTRHPRGRGTAERSRIFADVVGRYFEDEYRDAATPPRDIVHVTCTGYASPSPAQRLVAAKGWGAATRVTHAYHMGCYAAFPAVRLAMGALATPRSTVSAVADDRVDVVHSELCSLHFDPGASSIEQLVVQSLFADGFIRYAVTARPVGPALRVLALSEAILPDTADQMAWIVSDHGMAMTLAREVPDHIARHLRDFVVDLYARAGLDAMAQLGASLVAVHPGGPRIVDRVRDVLELADPQVQASRDVLRDFGNMSSATLPHVWQRIVADPGVAPGALVLSLAFGPGLTVCGGLFRKT